MTCSTWTAAILLALASHAHGFAALQQLRPTPCHQAAAAATPLSARPAVAAVRLQAAEGGEPEPAAAEADVEVVQDAAETPEAAENPPADAEGAASAEEEEEEEDLLSTPAFLKQKLKVLEKELEEVLAKTEEARADGAAVSEEWVDKRKRLQGDFDNFRARHANQTREAQVEARIKVVQDFLPVLDNFDRARMSISPEGEAQEAANAQYLAMRDELMGALAELGMEQIETVGAEFDYNLHMAIQQIPNDEYDEGIVCSEMQPGYTVKGQLVRAAYVMVSSG